MIKGYSQSDLPSRAVLNPRRRAQAKLFRLAEGRRPPRIGQSSSIADPSKRLVEEIATFADAIVQTLPMLNRFARRLAGNRSIADDLVQETVLRALVHAHQFRLGSNLLAWLSTILRNVYFNEWRRQNRFELLDQGTSPVRAVEGDQEWKLWISDVTGRFAGLHPEQREALMLVCANGYSYDHAAEIAGCPPGTMKSRVFRARSELRTMLSCDDRNGTTDHLHACITAVSAAA